jgi:TonB C terminal
MKKRCYLLSIVGHSLLVLIALHADFPIVIIPAPPRVIAVEIAAPPPFFSPGPMAKPTGSNRARLATPGGAGGKNFAAAPTSGTGGTTFKGANGLPFTIPLTFSLKEAPEDTFTLAPADRGSGLGLRPVGPGGPLPMGKYSASIYNPGVMMDGAAGPGGGILIPFDIKEKTVAAWTETVLDRIERNWIIPVSARLVFSGQVQVTLTIEKNGSPQALVMDDPSLPEAVAQSALHAVKASLPLPPLPENVAGQSFAFTFVFIYNG